MGDALDLDLDDIENYPRPVFEYYKENKLYKEHLERKEAKITKVENAFHKFAEKRVMDVAKARKKRGLRVEGERADKIVANEKKKSKKAERGDSPTK